MDLTQQLQQKYNKEVFGKLVADIGNDVEKFDKLIQVFFNSGTHIRLASHASWVLSNCVENHPILINPYMEQIIDLVESPIHETAKRNMIRAWQFINIEEPYQGLVLNICFDYLNKKETSIACRVYSLVVVANLTKHFPELKNELIVIIEDQLPYQSPAFISTGKKILAKLKRVKIKPKELIQ